MALDGTKLHANASRHSALSYGHTKKIEKQLKQEVKQLLRLTERADAQDIPDGMSVPETPPQSPVPFQAINYFDHKERQMPLRQPLIHRRWQQKPGVAVDRPAIAHRCAV